MTATLDSRSCLEVLGDVDAAVRSVLQPNQQYFVLGGIATSAIRYPNSVFDHQTERLIAAPESSEPVIRPENGTRRDIDVLVLDVMSKERATQVSQTISLAVRKALVVSVFGVTEHVEPTIPNRISRAFTAFTSERTVDETGQLRYELYPAAREVSRESYSPWALELPRGGEVPILNPAAHMLAYYMRSISGLRHKDREKATDMKRIIEGSPTFREQMEDGELKPWRLFVSDIAHFADKEIKFAKKAEPTDTRLEVKIFELKAQLLKAAEGNETIIKYAQKGLLQKLLKPFIGAS